MDTKEITVVFCGRYNPRDDWDFPIDEGAITGFLTDAQEELARYGVTLCHHEEPEMVIVINGYGDILNSIRLRSPRDGFVNLCLGNVIGTSPNRDLIEDLKRGINRVAFAPETIAPEDHNKHVCHNCGCGC
ncbi:hypothetical protein [Trichloromonas sp.]|uniref:hypothetical protein n=1 Tax=Trichloromonas sp. TaxID=3069249 RepID=UPI002A458EEB|nr:hypothetical protein [Trichloromonas sp.]